MPCMNDKLDHSYMAEIHLLAHGVSVKLGPCWCSHSIHVAAPAGQIAAAVSACVVTDT